MDREINNSIQKKLFSSGAPTNLCAESLYAAYYARNYACRSQQRESSEELLTGMKPSVAHL